MDVILNMCEFVMCNLTNDNLSIVPTGTINLSQLRDVTKALPGKLPVQIKFRLFPIDCDVRDVLF